MESQIYNFLTLKLVFKFLYLNGKQCCIFFPLFTGSCLSNVSKHATLLAILSLHYVIFPTSWLQLRQCQLHMDVWLLPSNGHIARAGSGCSVGQSCHPYGTGNSHRIGCTGPRVAHRLDIPLLDYHKSMGSSEIHPSFLTELAKVFIQPPSISFISSPSQTGRSQMTGGLPT